MSKAEVVTSSVVVWILVRYSSLALTPAVTERERKKIVNIMLENKNNLSRK